MFASSTPHGGLQPTQYLLEGQGQAQAIQDVPRAHQLQVFLQLIEESKRSAAMLNIILDIMLDIRRVCGESKAPGQLWLQ